MNLEIMCVGISCLESSNVLSHTANFHQVDVSSLGRVSRIQNFHFTQDVVSTVGTVTQVYSFTHILQDGIYTDCECIGTCFSEELLSCSADAVESIGAYLRGSAECSGHFVYIQSGEKNNARSRLMRSPEKFTPPDGSVL